jgi:sulfatase maturation enzyme AslB (radical SAM superfamily)
MAKIAIACSCVAGSDNAFDTLLIGRALAAAGHDVLYLADDIGAMHRTAASTQGLAILQAPLLQTAALDNPPPDKPEGFAAQLARAGYADPGTLRLVAGAWTALLRAIKVDCIIGIATPIAWLVGPHIAPTFATGRGRHLPAMPDGRIVSLPEEAAATVDQATLIANANTVLGELDLGHIDSLADVLGRCGQWHYGLDSFDPYRHFRRVPGFGPLGAAPAAFTKPARNRLSLFLNAQYPGIEAALLALVGMGDLRLDLFVQDATPAMKNFLSGLVHVVLHPTLEAALAVPLSGAAVIHHGTPLISEHGVLQGRPHLVLPWTTAHWNTLEHLKILGVAWWKEPGKSVQELATTFRAVGHDADIAIAAERERQANLTRNVGEAALGIVAAVEREIAPMLRPTQPVAADSGAAIGKAVEESLAGHTPPAEIQADVSKVFCAMPFEHMCVGNEGTVRICCMAPDLVTENDIPMSLYTRSAEEIWNSEYMRDVRRKIVAGEPLSQCQACYDNEAATSTSYRTDTGLKPFTGEKLDVEAMRNAAIANDYRVETFPQFIKLELGNLCNLKCRMCYGGSSSEIERDPVHSTWAGGADPMHAVWQGEYANIGPNSRIGVLRRGIHEQESSGESFFSWTDGAARFDVPLGPRNRPRQIIIEFDKAVPFSRICRISVNGRLLRTGWVGGEVLSVTLDIDTSGMGQSLVIDVESGREWNKQLHRWEGLPLSGVRLRRDVAPADMHQQVVFNPRFETPGLWYKKDELVFKELLGEVERLKRFYVTGGEPLLEPRFAEILDYLVSHGVAKNIEMELTTNCTVVDDDVLDKLAQFKSVLMTVSIDGVGPVQEYVRYPSRWATIEKNVRLLKRPNFFLCAIAVVQSYNMLDLANICRFGRDLDIEVSLMNILRDPMWLRTSVMPRNVQRLAADRLQQLIDEGCNQYLQGQAESLIRHYSAHEAPLDIETLRTFNLFTNDLDVSRGQSFKASLPELHALIEDAGYRWSDETLYAGKVGSRRPARERAHAWV